MDTRAVQSKYLAWQKALLRSEIDNDFRLARLIPASSAKAKIEAVKRLKPEERERLFAIWLCSYERDLTPAEQSTLQAFTLFWVGDVRADLSVEHDWPVRRVRVRGLRRILTRNLTQLLGPVDERSDDPSSWWHVLPLRHGWTLRTVIDVGGNWQLRYGHDLIAPGALKGVLGGQTLLQEFGFDVDLLKEDEAERGAEVLHLFCKTFIDELPRLLEETYDRSDPDRPDRL